MRVKKAGIAVVLSLSILLASCQDLLGGSTSSGPTDTAPPANISSVIVTERDEQLILSWVDSVDEDLAEVLVSVDPGPPGSTSIPAGVENHTLSGLSNGTTYTITLMAKDSAGNSSSGIAITGTPVAPSWHLIGPAGFPGDSPVDMLDLVLDSKATPYVAYRRGADPTLNSEVQKFDGAAWSALGGETLGPTGAFWPRVAVDSADTLTVVYADVANGSRARVLRLEEAGWANVGSGLISVGSAAETDIFIDDSDDIYVAYRDANSSNHATAQVFDGTSWTTVGTSGFSAGAADDTRIAVNSSGTPFVAYRDDGNGNRLTVMVFREGSWSSVGAVGFSAGEASELEIVMDSNDVPYVAYQDEANGNAVTVERFVNDSWQVVGPTGFSGEASYYPRISIGASDTPYVAYLTATANPGEYAVTVSGFSDSTWTRLPSAGIAQLAHTAIAVSPGGTPYVAYRDAAQGGRATVKRYGYVD